MDRVEAAQVLGVSADASAAEVHRAFRVLARHAHPDTASSDDSAATAGVPPDLDALSEARNVLLTPEPPPADASAAAVAAEPTVWTNQRQQQHQRQQQLQSSRTGCLAGGIVLVFLFAGAVVTLILMFAALFGGGGPGGSDVVPSRVSSDELECVIVDANTVAAASCDAAGAQRVLSQASGARSCPVGQNTLIADSTTWCLSPAQP